MIGPRNRRDDGRPPSSSRMHVLPVNDAIPRNTHDRTCFCRPCVERWGSSVIVVHNAADGRD